MATTYDRIRALLEQVKRNEAAGDKARDYYELAEYLANRQIKEFIVDANKNRFLSAAAIRRLLRLLSEMKLITVGEEDKVVLLGPAGRQALQGENYDRMVSQAALEMLNSFDITLESITDAIASVKLPNVPEAETIFEKLSGTRKEDLGFERFRLILYLLYWTRRLNREVKVLYGKRKSSAAAR